MPVLHSKIKNNMKNTLKLTLGTLLAVIALQGQAQQRPQHPSPEQMLERATEALNLNEGQVAEWEAIHEKYREEMQSDPRATIPKVDAELREILTKEQWEKFEKMKPKSGPARDK